MIKTSEVLFFCLLGLLFIYLAFNEQTLEIVDSYINVAGILFTKILSLVVICSVAFAIFKIY